MSNIYMTGIDVSHHNKNQAIFDIATNSQIDFLIAKATEGKTFRDKEFDMYMKYAKECSLLRGAYHYVNSDILDSQSATFEAYNFCNYVRPYGDCLLALDFEEKKMLNPDGVNYLFLLASEVELITGTKPLIYMSESTYKQFDFSAFAEHGFGLWSAKWGNNIPHNLLENGFAFNKAISEPFSVLAIQQISSKAYWDKKVIPLDVDVAFMSRDAWGYYANPRLRK